MDNNERFTLLDAAAYIGAIALIAFAFGSVRAFVALGVLALGLAVAWGVAGCVERRRRR